MKKVDNDYLSKLYVQYCGAIGKQDYDYYEIEDPAYFMEWILENKARVALYRDYLKNLQVDFSNAIELGKGNLDTLGIEGVRILSPHANTLGFEDSRICFVGGQAYIVKRNIEIIQDEKLIDHNTFDLYGMEHWAKDVASTGVDVSVGVYGGIYDKDYKLKVKLLTQLHEQLGEDYILNYDTFGYDYFATINSNDKKRVKVKTLSRVK